MRKRIIPALLLVCLMVSWLPVFAEESPPTYRTDFYEAVNAEWLATAEVPSDDYMVGGFGDLVVAVRDELMSDFKKIIADGVAPEDPRLAEFLKLYALARDYERRDTDGLEPIKPYLAKIEAIDSLAALQSAYRELMLDGMTLPFDLVPSEDFLDPTVKAMFFQSEKLILPDVAYYAEGNETGAYILQAFAGTAARLLALVGYTEEESALIIENAMAFDRLCVPLAMTAEEKSDISNLINIYQLADLEASIANFNVTAAVRELVGTTPETVTVISKKFADAFDTVINEENIPIIRDWMLVDSLFTLASYTTSDAIAAIDAYTNMMTGQAEPTPPERVAFEAARGLYSEVVGLYYADTYFGAEAKADVTAMVESLIDVFRQRLTANTWLSETTKAKALLKLDTMAMYIGYPEKIDPLYDRMLVETTADGGTYAGNRIRLNRLAYETIFDRYDEPTDRELWNTSADTVNAFYNPQLNSITFPAAVLQAPFYSREQSASANYGGIGAVIGHEITHAFDQNGSMFDENGAMANWWQPEDYVKFEELSQSMVLAFDGVIFHGHTLNGAQIVTENVADAGGLGCALQVVQSLPDVDLEAFFINWATIWQAKYLEQIEGIIIATDVHAPNKLRANFQPAMLDVFYETFGVVEGDPMYRPPEDRVVIW